MTIRAKWEKGVFRPIEPVNLPEATEVDVLVSEISSEDEVETPRQKRDREEILEILSRRFRSGHTDTAERHNEHQP